MSGKITVFLADDHAVVRDGLRALLEAQPDIAVIGDVDNGREAVRQVGQLRPDVTVIDIVMPGLNGIEAVQQIREACPTVAVIVLSMHHTTGHIRRALQAGASGYLVKESAGEEVIEAVRAVHAGCRYLGRQISDTIVESFVCQPQADPLDMLSSREREVLQLLVEGKSRMEVSEILSLSPKTVENYRVRLMQKLGVSDLPRLVKFAIRHGLTSLE